MRTAAILLIFMAALAGCTSEPGDAEAATPTQDADGAGNATVAPTLAVNATNHAPAANLSADAWTGAAPFEIVFSLNGTDPDGDALTWALDADGDGGLDAEGDALPDVVHFTFETAGRYHANLTVSDGQNETRVTAMIEVTETVDEVPPFEPVTLSQDRTFNCPGCILGAGTGSSTCLGLQVGENGLDCAWFELDPSWAGRTWTVDGSLVSFIEFYADCSGSSWLEATYESGATTGTVPAGAGCAVEWDPIDPVVTVTFTIT